MKAKIDLAVLYLIVAFFTYGYAYQEEMEFQSAIFPSFPVSNRAGATEFAFIAATFWPIYWPCHFSRTMQDKPELRHNNQAHT